MKKTYVIAAVVAIALIASSAFLYIYYQGQAAEEEKIKTLQNLLDDKGFVTSLSAYPTRIVSLAPSTTEILFALGLDDKVVAVSDYDNYPYNFTAWVEAGNMTSVGDFSNPNMEVIASVNPDLILATAGVQGESIDSLRSLNYKVLVLDPSSVEGVLQDIVLVGNATGYKTQATSLVNSLRSRIDAVVEKVASAASKPKVYYEVWYDPTSLWSAGSKAWQNELIEKAGGTNIFADQQLDYFQSSAEAVISRNPDVILLPSQMGSGGPFWISLDAVKARLGWNSISAVQNDRLYQVDGDVIARAGPRVADAIEALARYFHPELF
ncbi:cobalamin-binding protein [Candidatus Bathyarchaeota archaeon]|nr:cobalamin-binding protein [Candidatus Bathyarchaeota archaeon]